MSLGLGGFSESTSGLAGELSPGGRESVASLLLGAPLMTVRWVNGRERLTLFHYKNGQDFLEAAPGISTGRAVIGRDSILIQGSQVLALTAGQLRVASMKTSCLGSEATRIEFLIGRASVCTLSSAGMSVPRFVQSETIDPDPGAFQFFNGGEPWLSIGARGVVFKSLGGL